MFKHALVLALGIVMVGCADESEPVVEPSGAEALTVSDPAVATLMKGGDYRFSLDDSAVAADVERRCAEAPAPASCLAEIRAAAAGEGIALSPLDGGRLRYVSYAHENGERIVLIDGDIALRPLGDGIVEIVGIELRVGKMPPEGVRLLLEVVDDDTIAMDKIPGAHPRTGDKRLVFHRQAP